MPSRLALAAALLPAACAAQPIATDRPDFTENTAAVAYGRVQVEAGATLSVSDASAGRETSLSGAEVLVRIGLGRGIEARVTLPDAEAPVTSRLGAADVSGGSVGVKAVLGTARGVDATAIVDVARTAGGGASPRAVLIVGRDVGPSVAAGGQVELAFDPDADRVLAAATLVGGLALGSRVGTFAEVAVSGVPEGRAAVVLHHGYTLALAETLQIDVHGGVGLTRAAPDVFVGAGVAVRF